MARALFYLISIYNRTSGVYKPIHPLCVAFFCRLLQFMDRLKLLLMPAKHQPDLVYLRHVPLRKVHLFTFIQVLCLALLWILKSTVAAIIFPVMVRHTYRSEAAKQNQFNANTTAVFIGPLTEIHGV